MIFSFEKLKSLAKKIISGQGCPAHENFSYFFGSGSAAFFCFGTSVISNFGKKWSKNRNSKSKLEIEIEARNRNSKSKLEIETRNRSSKSKLEIKYKFRVDFFLQNLQFGQKIGPETIFDRRVSYHFKTSEFKNWRAFEFSQLL